MTLFVKQVQFEESTHNLGGNFDRNGTDCAICHTHQGFLEILETNASETASDIVDPAPINCRTCHQIHETYTDADFALTTTDPFTLYNEDYETGAGIMVDFGEDAGNLCARCHQGRSLTSRVAGGVPEIGGPDVQITSSRYGLHHGPQAQVVGGVGAYEFEGSNDIFDGPHIHGDPSSNPGLCSTCHMALATGVELGGHTFRMSFESNGEREPNVAGCNTCHNGFEDFSEFGDVPGEVEGLLVQLEQMLVNAGIKREMTPGYTFDELNPYVNTGVWSANLAAAMLNWQLFAEDRSLGLHNPEYVKAVLENTIEAIGP